MLVEKDAMKIEKMLLSRGYRCFFNVPIKGKFPDIIALRNKQVIAIEIKKNVLEIPTAIGQCIYYMENANKVYIALPDKEIDLLNQTTLSILKKYRIGIIKYDKSAKIVIDASKRDAKNDSLVNSLEKMPKTISKNRDDIEKIILSVLASENDIPLNYIAKAISINRITASKYLAILEAKGLIKHRNIGKAKLFSMRSGK